MTTCPRCFHCFGVGVQYRQLIPANDNPLRRVYVASDRYLRQPINVRRIAISLKSVPKSRRRLPDWVADVIYRDELDVRYLSGEIYELHDTLVDDILPDVFDCRWVSELLKFADQEPKQRTADKMLPRYRLLELALFLDKFIDRPKRRYF